MSNNLDTIIRLLILASFTGSTLALFWGTLNLVGVLVRTNQALCWLVQSSESRPGFRQRLISVFSRFSDSFVICGLVVRHPSLCLLEVCYPPLVPPSPALPQTPAVPDTQRPTGQICTHELCATFSNWHMIGILCVVHMGALMWIMSRLRNSIRHKKLHRSLLFYHRTGNQLWKVSITKSTVSVR